MRRKSLLIAAIFLGSTLVAPLATRTTSARPQVEIGVKIYDRDHKDYHVWDDTEAKFYEGWRHDHPEFQVDFRKNSRAQQSAYWKWRHEHPDHN
jgi:hypothetical protein